MTAPDLPPPTTPLRVLVADDEESMQHFLRRGLQRLGHQVTVVGDGEQAVAAWPQQAFDVAVLDLKMPVLDGLQALGRLRALDPDAVVLLATAHGSIATAVDAIRLGAADFVTKPFPIEELQLRIESALRAARTRRENQHLRSLTEPADAGLGVVAHSPPMRDLLQKLDLLRSSAATVLLSGESGTGKGLLAKALHLGSARRDGPFVALNCAAVPDTLVESELFGHAAGAFTGARTAKAGLLQRAHRGTVLLDEIGDMSLAAQAKIERFLQDREFVPLGATAPVRVDVRVIAASNRDLAALCQQGRFRPELLWRLDVVHLHVPPLRDRREDIAPLLQQALQRRQAPGAPAVQLSPEAIGALCAYDWPGNVRELENVVERLLALAGGRTRLGLPDLPEEVRGPDGGADPAADDYEAARARFDRAYFQSLLQRCGGNITAAARRAGISRGHLHRRLRELGGDAGAARHPEGGPGEA